MMDVCSCANVGRSFDTPVAEAGKRDLVRRLMRFCLRVLKDNSEAAGNSDGVTFALDSAANKAPHGVRDATVDADAEAGVVALMDSVTKCPTTALCAQHVLIRLAASQTFTVRACASDHTVQSCKWIPVPCRRDLPVNEHRCEPRRINSSDNTPIEIAVKVYPFIRSVGLPEGTPSQGRCPPRRQSCRNGIPLPPSPNRRSIPSSPVFVIGGLPIANDALTLERIADSRRAERATAATRECGSAVRLKLRPLRDGGAAVRHRQRVEQTIAVIVMCRPASTGGRQHCDMIVNIGSRDGGTEGRREKGSGTGVDKLLFDSRRSARDRADFEQLPRLVVDHAERAVHVAAVRDRLLHPPPQRIVAVLGRPAGRTGG
jgi:hypothetical protein